MHKPKYELVDQLQIKFILSFTWIVPTQKMIDIVTELSF